MLQEFIRDRHADDKLLLWLLINKNKRINFSAIARDINITRQTARKRYGHLVEKGYTQMEVDLNLDLMKQLCFSNLKFPFKILAIKTFDVYKDCHDWSSIKILREIGYDSDNYHFLNETLEGLSEMGLIEYGFEAYDDEVFIDIEGYDGDYQVSNYGRVVSKKKGDGKYQMREMSLYTNKRVSSSGEYPLVQVLLTKDSIQSLYNVARLVAKAFMPLECYEGMQIHHIDKDPANNKVGNLIWLTVEEHREAHRKK